MFKVWELLESQRSYFSTFPGLKGLIKDISRLYQLSSDNSIFATDVKSLIYTFFDKVVDLEILCGFF